MKIAVASDNGITLTGHVGRCEMFIVFEIIKNEIINIGKRINSFTMHKQENHQHEHNGTNRHGGIVNGLKDCNYLVCSSCGQGLIDDLLLSGVQTILTEEMEAEKAVKLFIEDKLENDPNKKCKEHHH
ncbi:MAG: NifB/NifX family molybdenum-iron cluster-binding protein [Ignavibacteria bacterium]|jgi:predicted Fe-Mo cluster-binding NifX family protein